MFPGTRGSQVLSLLKFKIQGLGFLDVGFGVLGVRV